MLEHNWESIDHRVISFEAKKDPIGPNHNFNNACWGVVRVQIEHWCDRVDGVGEGHPYWGIGAIRNVVKFWIYTGSTAYNGQNSKMVPVYCDALDQVQIDWSNPWNQGEGSPAEPSQLQRCESPHHSQLHAVPSVGRRISSTFTRGITGPST
jgi:hypothetical protein